MKLKKKKKKKKVFQIVLSATINYFKSAFICTYSFKSKQQGYKVAGHNLSNYIVSRHFLPIVNSDIIVVQFISIRTVGKKLTSVSKELKLNPLQVNCRRQNNL